MLFPKQLLITCVVS